MSAHLDPIHPQDPTRTCPPPAPRWEDRIEALLGFAVVDLETGGLPLPMLAAFAGDDPVGLATVRPFAAGEATQAVVELLALLLPLGTDRVALSLPGRAWSTRDPIVPMTDGVDLRATVLVLLEADASVGPCRVTSHLHPVTTDGGPGLGPAVASEDAPQAPLADALAILLDARDELTVPEDQGLALAAQYGRVLLRGHDLALAPAAARAIHAASGTPEDPVRRAGG